MYLTKTNILTAQYLIEEHKCEYILPTVNSTDPTENILGETMARQINVADEVFILIYWMLWHVQK